MPRCRSRIGTVLNALFTISGSERYTRAMVSLALAAAIAAAQPWQPQSGVTAQATATVRIVSGQRVRFTDANSETGKAQPRPRETKLKIDGGPVPAVLIEFS